MPPRTSETPRVVHLAHGTPDFALPGRSEGARWRAALAGIDPDSARALVVVSAHAASPRGLVLAGGSADPPLLHDYRGFDPSLSTLALSAPAAAPDLREEILSALAGLGIPVRDEPRTPLDHGVWVPLIGALGPRLSCPVFALGLPLHLPLERIREGGERLAPLLPGVVWITSGGVVHNLAALDWSSPDGPPFGWARDFWESVSEHLGAGNPEPLLRPWELPGGSLAVPTREHYAPFVFATGLAAPDRPLAPRAMGFAYRSLSLEVLADRPLPPGAAAPLLHPPRPKEGS